MLNVTDNEIIREFEEALRKSYDTNAKQKAEIERLNIKNKTLAAITKNYDWKFAKAKSDAYREFADKLAGAFNKDINLYGRCTLSDVALKINTTLKELTDQTATNQSVSLIDGHIEE